MESKALLAKLGITDVDVVGDTRFDRVLQIKEASKQLPIVEQFTAHAQKVFVAGSSWLPDEEIFIKYFDIHKDWKLIIAPHVISDEHLSQIFELLKGRRVVRYTEATEDNVKDAEVLIIDCFGLLSSIYHYGTVSYVGGGFGVGIHNVLEAAVWDIPVVFGPNNKHFQEAQGLMLVQGGFEIKDYQSFRDLMMRFETDASFLQNAGENAGAFVKSRAGATAKVMENVSL